MEENLAQYFGAGIFAELSAEFEAAASEIETDVLSLIQELTQRKMVAGVGGV